VALFDAVVLAGGGAVRLGGVDKPSLEFAGRSALERVLDASGAAQRQIVVGPRRELARRVIWCREEPPGAGPVAAIGAGIRHATAPYVAVLAGDLPLLDGVAVHRLVDAARRCDGAVLVDAAGDRQVLAAVYAREPLLARLADVAFTGAVRRLVAPLRLAEVADLDDVAQDVDTWDDVGKVRDRL
jgi:molybdopterin-guanine dinucleotide biosynthesis protein A